MALRRVTAPAPILSTAEVKKHLRVEHDEHDALIDAYLQAATDLVDGPDGKLGRALGPQTWDWFVDATEFPSVGPMEIPLAPVISVEEVEYTDSAGSGQVWADYAILGLGGHARIGPPYSGSWPSYRASEEAMRVRFVAGYAVGNGDSPEVLVEAVPYPIKVAILLLVGDLYANRETSVTGPASAIPMSATVQNLLAPYRVWNV